VELNLEMGAEMAPEEIGTVEVPNAALGINGGMAAKVKIGGGITEVPQEEKLTIMKCSEFKSKTQREDFCKKNYPHEAQFKVCVEDFCSLCCKRVIPPERQASHLEKCTKVCDSQEEEVKDKDKMHTCVEPPDKTASFYRWCEGKVNVVSRRQSCK